MNSLNEFDTFDSQSLKIENLDKNNLDFDLFEFTSSLSSSDIKMSIPAFSVTPVLQSTNEINDLNPKSDDFTDLSDVSNFPFTETSMSIQNFQVSNTVKSSTENFNVDSSHKEESTDYFVNTVPLLATTDQFRNVPTPTNYTNLTPMIQLGDTPLNDMIYFEEHNNSSLDQNIFDKVESGVLIPVNQLLESSNEPITSGDASKSKSSIPDDINQLFGSIVTKNENTSNTPIMQPRLPNYLDVPENPNNLIANISVFQGNQEIIKDKNFDWMIIRAKECLRIMSPINKCKVIKNTELLSICIRTIKQDQLHADCKMLKEYSTRAHFDDQWINVAAALKVLISIFLENPVSSL